MNEAHERQSGARCTIQIIANARHTFVGFYADVSLLEPDREYRVDLELPPLAAGRFQGLYVENVEAEYTSALAEP